jgi:hypothetical protein
MYIVPALTLRHSVFFRVQFIYELCAIVCLDSDYVPRSTEHLVL